MGDIGPKFTGHELDEGEGKESGSIPTGADLKSKEGEGEGKETKPIPEEEDSKSDKKRYKSKKKLTLLIAIGVCFLSGTGYLFLKFGTSLLQNDKTRLIERYDVPKNQNITFHSFVIPFKENSDFTYISLSITFDLPNREVKREILENKDRLRGVVYDVLKAEINRYPEVPPIEKLKGPILEGVNGVLYNDKVKDIYIDQFLAG